MLYKLVTFSNNGQSYLVSLVCMQSFMFDSSTLHFPVKPFRGTIPLSQRLIKFTIEEKLIEFKASALNVCQAYKIFNQSPVCTQLFCPRHRTRCTCLSSKSYMLVLLGPLHMSPVDRAGLVSEISPRHSFLYKNFDVFIWEGGLARLPRSRFLRPRSR